MNTFYGKTLEIFEDIPLPFYTVEALVTRRDSGLVLFSRLEVTTAVESLDQTKLSRFHTGLLAQSGGLTSLESLSIGERVAEDGDECWVVPIDLTLTSRSHLLRIDQPEPPPPDRLREIAADTAWDVLTHDPDSSYRLSLHVLVPKPDEKVGPELLLYSSLGVDFLDHVTLLEPSLETNWRPAIVTHM